MTEDNPLSPKTMKIAQFCAQECEKQRSGELSVFWMMQAYQHALWRKNYAPTLEDVEWLGVQAEPRRNKMGRGQHAWRQVQVTVGGRLCMDWQLVPRAMENLWKVGVPTVDPTALYYEFETIHPFADGNGRVGAILYNWLKGTLDSPEFPPDFWASGGTNAARSGQVRAAGR